jgi:hypothetical protein
MIFTKALPNFAAPIATINICSLSFTEVAGSVSYVIQEGGSIWQPLG